VSRPPHLVVGRRSDGAELDTRDGATEGGVEVRGTAFLRFNSAEVLHLPPDTTPGVLPEPVHQRREVDGVAGGPPVVIPLRIASGPVGVDSAVGVQGEGEEGRGPVPASEHPSHCAVLDGSAR
jgi:hypothetical protein